MNIGVVGAGQLGRMLALAGYPLGFRFQFLDPGEDACAGQVAPQLVKAYDDPDALATLSERSDIISFEFENVPHEALRFLSEHRPAYPPARALEVAQDRLQEKTLFSDLGIPTPGFLPVESRQQLADAVSHLGLPAVLKTRRLGYDGKGQFVIRNAGDLDIAWDELGTVPLILEQFIPFDREVSLIAARNQKGETVFYPLSENEHRNGMLHLSIPHADDPLQSQAEEWVTPLLQRLEYVGVLAFEFFVKDGTLLANEIAPRVHNSGHWTIEGAETSQFENHLRAITGLPLGSTRLKGHVAMLNLVGQLPDRSRVLEIEGASFHDYGKESRAGRKVGHITLRAESADELQHNLARLASIT